MHGTEQHVDTDGFHRTGVAAAFVTMRYVPEAEAGRAFLDEVLGQWAAVPRPAEIVSLGAYLDTEGQTVLTCVQVSAPDAYARFAGALTGPAAAEAVAYRPYRSVVFDPAPVEPGCVVVATFDVDGPGRQRLIADSLCDALESQPPGAHPGMLSANFHTTADGTRVLNFAEWTTDEEHIAFLEGAGRAGTYRISTRIPGVRPIGFKRFHRHVRST
ncbi:hypothetical protein AB0D65_27800 [Streptomyces griseoloalbus]|uniref:ABM domain-containing protein n=1 Tax=Streptomyces griseoloalbus TaxID=67303 RepID=A0ABV3EET5_9ACTN